MNRSIMPLLLIAVFFSCRENKERYDATGSFEAVETVISAEASGVIRELDCEEGLQLQPGQVLGYIDTTQLQLKKEQLQAQIRATGSRIPDIPAQADVFREQLKVAATRLDYLNHEKTRIGNLVKADAATPKQLDDITAQITEAQKQLNVIRQQEAAQVSVLKTQAAALRSDVQPLYFQILQIEDQIKRSKIVNPANGVVLTKYAEKNETAAPGKPLYKIADLSGLILRAYFTGSQLGALRLDQQVDVIISDLEPGKDRYPGTVEWISSQAEFTPKTILTKEERANQVYAVKIRVKNDGAIKLGMMGEVRLHHQNAEN